MMTTDENGKQLAINDRVEGGNTQEDYDTGTIGAIEGDQVTVLWDSHVKTTQAGRLLRKIS